MEMGASSSRSDEEQVETWRQISAQVHRIRHTPFPTAANELLQDRLREAPDGPFATAYQREGPRRAPHKLASNCLQMVRLREQRTNDVKGLQPGEAGSHP
jgi:hypothetical protein